MQALILTGRVLEGFDEQAVWESIAPLFKLELTEFRERLVSRCPRLIQRMEPDRAQHIRRHLEQRGAEAWVGDIGDVLWQIVLGGKIRGPVPLAYLRAALDQGRISADAKVRSETERDWIPLGRVVGPSNAAASAETSQSTATLTPTAASSRRVDQDAAPPSPDPAQPPPIPTAPGPANPLDAAPPAQFGNGTAANSPDPAQPPPIPTTHGPVNPPRTAAPPGEFGNDTAANIPDVAQPPPIPTVPGQVDTPGAAALPGELGGDTVANTPDPTQPPPLPTATGPANPLAAAPSAGFGNGTSANSPDPAQQPPISPQVVAPNATSALAYAGFWRRALAYLIDSAIVGIPAVLLAFAITALSIDEPADAELAMELLGFNYITAYLFFGLLYWPLMEASRRQATLGKMVMGIRVTDVQGGRISIRHAYGRHIASALNQLTMGVGYFLAGWTKYKQALHDLIAKTLVIVAQPQGITDKTG